MYNAVCFQSLLHTFAHTSFNLLPLQPLNDVFILYASMHLGWSVIHTQDSMPQKSLQSFYLKFACRESQHLVMVVLSARQGLPSVRLYEIFLVCEAFLRRNWATGCYADSGGGDCES